MGGSKLRAYHGHTTGIYGHVTRGNYGHSRSPLVTFKPLQSKGLTPKSLERATRIELAFSAWEADVLPLNYARISVHRIVALTSAGSRQDFVGGSTTWL